MVVGRSVGRLVRRERREKEREKSMELVLQPPQTGTDPFGRKIDLATLPALAVQSGPPLTGSGKRKLTMNHDANCSKTPWWRGRRAGGRQFVFG